MDSFRTILSIALIPALLAAQTDVSQLPPSVRAALRNPRKERVLLTRKDGTVAEGLIVRTSTQFLAFDGAGGCKNVELTDIAKISKVASERLTASQIIGTVLLYAFLPLIYFAGWDSQPAPKPDNPVAATWESVHPLPDGRVSRIQIRGESVQQKLVSIRTGRYEFKQADLTLNFEDAAGLVEEHHLARFDCNRLVLDGQRFGLSSQPKQKNRAEPPILGRWESGQESGQATRWQFRADGTFQAEAFGQGDLESGTLQRQKAGFHVEFNRPHARAEDWRIRMKAGHLFIHRSGETMEYRKTGYF